MYWGFKGEGSYFNGQTKTQQPSLSVPGDQESTKNSWNLHRQHTMENQYKLSKSWHILQPSWDRNALPHIFIQLNRHTHQGNIKKQSKCITIWVKKTNN